MSARVLIVFEVGEPVSARLLGVKTADDALRLKREIQERLETLDPIRAALADVWGELISRTREAS